MIRYPITRAELEARIEAESKGWLKQAAERTEKFRKNKAYQEASPIWSKVKVVYMRLQGDCKCAYCERKLESEAFGKGEQDVEHFRPKSNVSAWKYPNPKPVIKVTAPAGKSGYYLLPYNPFNYAAACKPCNSALKSDYFPIAGKYVFTGDDPGKLRGEKPYLLYPIGDVDGDDPEQVIKFNGTSPCPVAASGYKRNRALVTIEFFRLDDAIGRKNLLLERASVITALYPALVAAAAGDAVAKSLVKGYTANSARHTNCARSFQKLFEADKPAAQQFYESAAKLIASSSGGA